MHIHVTNLDFTKASSFVAYTTVADPGGGVDWVSSHSPMNLKYQ